MDKTHLPKEFRLIALDASGAAAALEGLAHLLHDCVLDGASIGFILPHDLAEARGFWRDKILPGLATGSSSLLVAVEGGSESMSGAILGPILGCVVLECATPGNQPHRAEIRKLLVHPGARRRGIARALMAGIEAMAAARGRWLLVLDTRTGDAAEPLYRALGYETVGVIRDYCLDVQGEHYDSTTIMAKYLARVPASQP